MKFLRNILIILVPLYFLITWLRNRLYDWNIFKSHRFSIPIICVGNLNVGGTGKSPMIEYLIQMLNNKMKIATLSRGYKRNTRGFILADENATAQSIGDEPYQFYSKFNSLKVAVDANRVRGIESLLSMDTPPDIILLDDAFQHRKVKPGLSILLTAYEDLYADDILLPTGNLREPKSGAARADLVVVTKCPEDIDNTDKKNIEDRLKLNPNQKLFFSHIGYSEIILQKGKSQSLETFTSRPFTLVTGIANAKPLVMYLKRSGYDFTHLEYDDHHMFTEKEIENIESIGLVLTTEKDYVRMQNVLSGDQVWYLPIQLVIDKEDEFCMAINAYLGY